MRIIYFLVLLLSILSTEVKAQKKELYKFIVENKVMVESLPGFYVGLNREHNQIRIVHKDSIYEEVNLFTNGSNVFFKIKNGNWYIKNSKKWELFYSHKTKISPKIKLGNLIYTLTYKDKTKIGKIDCINYLFENFEADNTTEKNGIKTVNISLDTDCGYCFSPKYGFIKEYLSDGVTLIREDILNRKN